MRSTLASVSAPNTGSKMPAAAAKAVEISPKVYIMAQVRTAAERAAATDMIKNKNGQVRRRIKLGTAAARMAALGMAVARAAVE